MRSPQDLSHLPRRSARRGRVWIIVVVIILIVIFASLKTFLVKNGKPFLKAENPKYPDLIPSEELVIQGVFRALIRKARE